MAIESNLRDIRDRIASAALAGGREPASVRLVAVSKTRPAEDVREALRAGQTVFGENYVQELVEKAAGIQEAVEWHFIGHMQSNKVKQIAGLVSMIHSVDRLSLAEEISRQWGKLGCCCDILIQVNISGEATKSGTSEAEALQLVRAVAQLPNVRVQGLMTMPPFFDDPEAARPFFAELLHLSQLIEAEGVPGVEMRELSMGMSGDFEAAIQEGATLVRIGTSIFGTR
ncbi:MAG: YggS family pyridoxal phosphate-dependent enzyme [Desulfuromonadales bacterium]|nr:YggS family pyridoxal phosphate-dependent enzyme [Desulfuromonadales bacterium]